METDEARMATGRGRGRQGGGRVEMEEVVRGRERGRWKRYLVVREEGERYEGGEVRNMAIGGGGGGGSGVRKSRHFEGQ